MGGVGIVDKEFKEGLRRYVILIGKSHGYALSDEESEEYFQLFTQYGIYEEARVQWGAEPTFEDEEYNTLIEEGRALQKKH